MTIGFLPPIYEHETFYSWLSRAHVRSGMSATSYALEIISKSSPYLDLNFFNNFKPEFIDLLKTQMSIEELVLEHTLFKHYARFLPLDKRTLAYEHALALKPNLRRQLPIPLFKNEGHYKIRYCPKCVARARDNWGESYFKTIHQIREVKVCVRCGDIPLSSTDIEDFKGKQIVFKSLEECNPMAVPDFIYPKGDIHRTVSDYVYEVYRQPLNFTHDVLIGKYLRTHLGKYMSARGEQIDLTSLEKDMAEFYKDLSDYPITKKRLATILLDKYINTYDICLIALFLDIDPIKLCNPVLPKESKTEVFDGKVKKLYAQGKSITEIGRIMFVHHVVIRNIVHGVYDKPKSNKARFRPSKYDWEKIDDECVLKLPSVIEQLKSKGYKSITKKLVAEAMGLKDASMRNLPKTIKSLQSVQIN
jgi:hypothetical protein